MPLGEALIRPVLSLLIAGLVPFATARLLAWVYLADLPPPGDERARRLAPFRRAAIVAGAAQLQLAFLLGATALGPSIVPSPRSAGALAFALITAVVAFCAGGVARRVEEPEDDRASVIGTVLLRLRLVPFFAGPLLVALLAAALPVVEDGRPAWGWVALAFSMVTAGVAWGGLLLSVVTGAFLPAKAPIAAAARAVADAERTSLAFVLRLPTAGTRFANAAALPWARAMVVADRTAEILDPDALRAVLAHEAGHLSEGPRVSLARVGAASLLLFVVAVGPEIAFTLRSEAAWAVLTAGALAGVLAIVSVRKLARAMEERADRRAAETVGAGPLARALGALHDNAQLPRYTGRRRVHPDLYDRLVALGESPGPRPPPPPRGGIVLGLACGVSMLALPLIVHATTDLPAAATRAATPGAARWRLRIDPWDGEAMLALAWHARAASDIDLALERAALAAQMGPDPQSYYLLWSELHAARGDCDAARDAFAASLEAQASRVFDAPLAQPLELGAYALPPTLVRECDLTVGDAFGGDATLRMQVQ